MKASRVQLSDDKLLGSDSSIWGQAKTELVDLFPTPIEIVKERSPFMALSKDHGRVTSVKVSALHNDKTLSVRLDWGVKEKSDRMDDIDQFVDAVAVLFPLSLEANIVTMGSPADPANAWYWKADETEPFDVLSEGFGATVRRPGHSSGLKVIAAYNQGVWSVVFQRPMAVKGNGYANFSRSKTVELGIAVWDGSNKERSGRKSFSGSYMDLVIE